MTNRKNYLVDKKFQFKKTFSVLSIVATTILLIVITMGSIIIMNNDAIEKNNLIISQNNQEIKDIIQFQVDFIAKYKPLKNGKRLSRLKKIPSAILIKHQESHIDLQKTIEINESIIESNSSIIKSNLLIIAISLFISFGGILFLYIKMIKETHRISGPIYLMTRHLKEINRGKYPDMRDLRSGDDFKEFYNLFRQMAEKIIKLENRKKTRE